jgi:hypothetical protein
MEQLFATRQAAYSLAHLRVPVGRAGPEDVADQILDAMPR